MGRKKEPKQWERQPKETAKAYAAFQAYRDLDPKKRTIAKVAEALGKTEGNMEQLSAKYHWVKRAEAWDAEADRRDTEAHLRDIVEERARQRKMAMEMQVKGMELMENIQPGDAKLGEIVSLLKLGMEQARICMGDVGKVIEERDGGNTLPSVTFYIPSNGRDQEGAEVSTE